MRRLAAPLALSIGAFLLRSPILGAKRKERLLRFLETRFAWLGVEKVAVTASGARLQLRSNDFLQSRAMLFGEWEPYLTRRTLDRAPSDRIWVDIGANIGYTALLGAARFEKVYAFEAAPTVFRLLEANIALNPALGARIVAKNVAIGAEPGETDIFLADETNIGRSSQSAGQGTLDGRVAVSRAADLIPPSDVARIGFIKIDVEGAEAAVLDGLQPLWDQLPLGAEILVEFEGDKANQALWARITALSEHGFRPYVLQGEYRLDEYLDPSARSPLAPLHVQPTEFSDVLLIKET